MGDRFRFFLTGLAACMVIGITVTGHGIWSTIFHHQERLPFQVPLSQLRDFDGITLKGPDDVVVTPGDKYAVTVDGDPAARRFVSLYVSGGVLHVERQPHDGWWGPEGGGAKVHVTMPGLTRLWLEGSGSVEVAKFDGKELRALEIGSGHFQLNDLKADSVKLTLRGSGTASASGTTNALTLVSEGSGRLDLAQLNARTADVQLRGSSSVAAHASESAKLDVAGSGAAHVTGTTKCQIAKVGSGEADCTS